MESSVVIAEIPWADWTLADWNRAWFFHFFQASDSHNDPVTRIAVTGESLRRIVHDESAAPKDIRRAFRNALITRLRVTGKSLCTDARESEWRTSPPTDCPPYAAHLVATCLVAAGWETDSPNKDFRQHLNQYLKEKSGNPRYSLGELPRLWQKLRIWLDKEIEAGKPFRRLVLPKPVPRLRLIGHSLGLAFPSLRDQKALVRIFSNKDLSATAPPVLSVLQLIDDNLSKFSQRFVNAFRDFRAAFLEGDEDLFAFPLWSSVKDAICAATLENPVAAHDHPLRVSIRLDRSLEWDYCLTVCCDREVPIESRASIAIVLTEELGLDDYPYIVEILEKGPGTTSAAHLLLSGELWREFDHGIDKGIVKTVADGVLLFTQSQDGVWSVERSLPVSGKVQSLIRNDRVGAFLTALDEAGARVNKRPSSYADWTEVDGFNAYVLRRANLSALADISACQPTVESPRLHLSGGVRLSSGWLGQRAALPALISSHHLESVTIEKVSASSTVTKASCIASPDSGNTYQIPLPPRLSHDLNGSYIVHGWAQGQIRSSAAIEFHASCLSADYRYLSRPDQWITEAGQTDVAQISGSPPTPTDIVTTGIGVPSTASAVGGVERPRVQVSTNVVSLIEILAAKCIRRQILGIAEIAELFRDVLNIPDHLLWDVVRAWEECGALDSLIHSRWRHRAYSARRPRFVISSRAPTAQVVAVLQGLVPRCVEEAVIAAASNCGAKICRFEPSSNFVPAPLVASVSDLESIIFLSKEAGLEAPEVINSIEHSVASIDSMASRMTELRANHSPYRFWNWSDGRFSKQEQNGAIDILWYRRTDAPDAYVVLKNGVAKWHSQCRVWALLVAARLTGKRPFACSADAELVRMVPGYHLPLAVGRWATVISGRSPSPIVSEMSPMEYRYFFPDAFARSKAIAALWPSQIPRPLLLEGAQIERLLYVRRSNDGLVSVPPSVRRLLHVNARDTGLRTLASAVMIPKHLFPRLMLFAHKLESAFKHDGGLTRP